MNKIIAGAVAATVALMVAAPAEAKGPKTRDLIVGAIVGGIIVDAYKSNNYNYGYSPSYTPSYSPSYNRYNPCSYTPDYRLEQYNPERAEYERGVAARLCREQEERKQRAYECGYYGTCQ